MPQDAFSLKHLTVDLNNLLVGAKVNKIEQPLPSEVVFTVYTGKKTERLIVSCNAESARISLTPFEKANPLTAYNFCMLLRKHLQGAVIESFALQEFERVIFINFSCKNDFFEREEKTLVVEIMGKYSNIILTSGSKILGSIKTSTLDEEYKRPILCGMDYKLPPPQEKAALKDVKNILKNFIGGNLGEYLFNTVKGLSSMTANEVAFRFFKCENIERLTEKQMDDFAGFLIEIIENPPKNPCVAFCGEKAKDYFVFPYKTAFYNYEYFDTVLEASSTFYLKKESDKAFLIKKQKLVESVKSVEKKFIKRLKNIDVKLQDCSDMETDRIRGELIISNIYQIPKNAEEIFVDNYYSETGEKIKISLDKTLSPSQNAQKYYKKYNKQKRTVIAVTPQREETETELNYIKSVYSEIDLAETLSDLLKIEEELIESGYIKAKVKEKKGAKKPQKKYLSYLFNGYTVKVGRNNVENDELTFSAKNNDMWLHAKNYHSSHVIIESLGKEIPQEVIKFAGEVCAYYSKGRQGEKIEIDYVVKKRVKKPKGAKMGFVIYTDYQTIIVNPDKKEEFLKSD